MTDRARRVRPRPEPHVEEHERLRAGLAQARFPPRRRKVQPFDLDELSAQWQVERRFHPTLPRERAAELMQRWEHAVAQATL